MLAQSHEVLRKQWIVAPEASTFPLRVSVLQYTLDRALKMLSGGTSKRLPILGGVLIQAEAYGVFSLSVTDFELTQTVVLPAKVERSGALVTDYATLKELTALLSPERIDFTVQPENNTLTMRCGTNRATLTKNFPAADFPVVNTNTGAGVVVTIPSLKQAADSLGRMADKHTDWISVALTSTGVSIAIDRSNAVRIEGSSDLDQTQTVRVPFAAFKSALANAAKVKTDGIAHLSWDGAALSISVGFVLVNAPYQHAMTYTARLAASEMSAWEPVESAVVAQITFSGHQNAKHKVVGAGKALAAAKDALMIDFETGTALVQVGETETTYTGALDTATPFQRVVLSGETLATAARTLKASKGDLTLSLLDNGNLQLSGVGFSPVVVQNCRAPLAASIQTVYLKETDIEGADVALDAITLWDRRVIDLSGNTPLVWRSLLAMRRVNWSSPAVWPQGVLPVIRRERVYLGDVHIESHKYTNTARGLLAWSVWVAKCNAYGVNGYTTFQRNLKYDWQRNGGNAALGVSVRRLIEAIKAR